jgi:hypothetical protein
VFTFTGSTVADLAEVVKLAEQGLLRNDAERFAFEDAAGLCATGARCAARTCGSHAAVLKEKHAAGGRYPGDP